MFRIIILINVILLQLYAELIRDNGIVTDTKHDLEWQDDYLNEKTVLKTARWEEAVRYCEELDLGGFDDWRLPSNRELLTLVVYDNGAPAISEVFEYSASFYYWSSTGYVNDNGFAWAVNFAQGATNIGDKTKIRTFVRCVRNH